MRKKYGPTQIIIPRRMVITPEEEEILEFVNNNPHSTIENIADEIKHSEGLTKMLITILLSKSKLNVKYNEERLPHFYLSESGKRYLQK